MLLFQLRLGVKLLLMFCAVVDIGAVAVVPLRMNVLVEVIPVADAGIGMDVLRERIVAVEVGTVDDGLLPVGETVIEVATVEVGKIAAEVVLIEVCALAGRRRGDSRQRCRIARTNRHRRMA